MPRLTGLLGATVHPFAHCHALPHLPRPHRLQIVKATKQVVAGMRYDLTLKVVRTACLNDALHQQDLGTCAPELGGERYIEAAVLIQPWKQPPMTATIKLPPRTEL